MITIRAFQSAMRILGKCPENSLTRENCRILATLHTSPELLSGCGVGECKGPNKACLMLKCQKSTAAGHQEKTQLASLRERGLINELLYKHVPTYEVKTLEIVDGGKTIEILWEDGHTSRFHSMWLRHSCHCTDCRLDHNGMNTVPFHEIGLDIIVTDVRIEDEELAIIKWEDSNGAHTHEGPIPLMFLRGHCYSEKSMKERREAIKMRFHEDATIPEVEYSDVMASDKGLYKWLLNLSERGICLVKNVPTEDWTVIKIAERIAPLQHTVYGETFNVVSMPQPINAAYSPVSLALHMDQPHYESAPGLQLLHCIQFDPSIVGGDNTFADIHEFARNLREERPEYFNTLSRVPVVYETLHYDRDYPVHLKNKKPIFSLDNFGELTSINWHPMMMGALQVPESDVVPFYEAYKNFFTMVRNSEKIYKLRMNAGDMISFNNRRILHGRASYTNQKGVRQLQGTYIELTEFQSRMQVLHNTVGDGRLAMRCGMLDLQ